MRTYIAGYSEDCCRHGVELGGVHVCGWVCLVGLISPNSEALGYQNDDFESVE